MKKIQLPDWLYKALPYFYLSVGLVILLTLRNVLAVLICLTLTSAGGIVWMLRSQSKPESQPTGLRKPGNGFVQISWRQAFECGHPVIDAQHRRLFDIANELIDAVLSKDTDSNVELLLEQLIVHIRAHFSTEEAILAGSSHLISLHHRKIHRALLEQAANLRNRYLSGEIVVGDLVGFITYDVIAEHVVNEVEMLRAEVNQSPFEQRASER